MRQRSSVITAGFIDSAGAGDRASWCSPTVDIAPITIVVSAADRYQGNGQFV